MPENELDGATVVPLSSETETERARIRASNDRDQRLEREGKPSPHNQGYDEVADVTPPAGDGEETRRPARSTNPGAEINSDWQSASNAGDETPGGDNPTPDQNVVDEIGHAVGVEYQDDEPLRGADKVDARAKNRWGEA
jgi:hypothetical protein